MDRRGQARVEIGKYEEAIEDFQKAKEVDPKTKNTEDKIDFARKLLEEKNGELCLKSLVISTNVKFRFGPQTDIADHAMSDIVCFSFFNCITFCMMCMIL